MNKQCIEDETGRRYLQLHIGLHNFQVRNAFIYNELIRKKDWQWGQKQLGKPERHPHEKGMWVEYMGVPYTNKTKVEALR